MSTRQFRDRLTYAILTLAGVAFLLVVDVNVVLVLGAIVLTWALVALINCIG